MNKFLNKFFAIFLVILFVMPPCIAQESPVRDLKCSGCVVSMQAQKEDGKVRILSIDGGGVKSLITLKMLDYIEQQTGKKTAEIFDYIAGTSSGGLLALYLTMPDENNPDEPKYSASDIIDLLKHDASLIFKKKMVSRMFGQKLVQIFRPAYHNKNIDKVMADRFGNLQMQDATTNTLVLTFDTQENQPVAFTNYTSYYNEAHMRDVAIGTSVAPFYLSPLLYHDKKYNKDRTLIDGGLVAKNASVFAYCEAKNLYPGKDIFLLSLGAGYQEKKQYDYEKLKGWGFFRLSLAIYTFMLDGTSNTNDLYLKKLFKASKNDVYYRFQPKLNKELTGFDNKPDNTTEENFKLLSKIGDMYVIDHKPELDQMIKKLRAEESI